MAVDMTARANGSQVRLEESVRTLLSDDHARLERSFQALVDEADAKDQADLRRAWRTFELELLAHMHAEEMHLIAAFERHHAEAAAALRREHEQIRAQLTELGIDLELHCLQPERISAFVGELRAHARREEELLYPWAARQLGETARVRVAETLAAARRDAPGIKGATVWRIDPTRSKLGFSLRHIVVHHIRGSFGGWGGIISLEPGAPAHARVDVWIDLASVDTGDPQRDDHVRSAEFFDVGRHPRAVFVSRSVGIADSVPVVMGLLSLHGVVAAVPVEITANEARIDPSGGERRVYAIRARLDRRQFGLRWNQDLDVGGVVVGDTIDIDAHVETVREQSGPS
jgi:polyisoprenoid-binding protein YceI